MAKEWINRGSMNNGMMLNSDSVASANSYWDCGATEIGDSTKRPKVRDFNMDQLQELSKAIE